MADQADRVAQVDFGAGIVRHVSVEDIPPNGSRDLNNYFLKPDGNASRRGGTVYKSGSSFGTSINFLWGGVINGMQRTLFASASAFGILDSDDSSVLNIGGSGIDEFCSSTVMTSGLGIEAEGDYLFINGAQGNVNGGHIYAGSKKTANYSTGTITATAGSKTITGSGTSWTANVDKGMLLQFSADGRPYAVQSVDSNTQITLMEESALNAGPGQTYTLKPVVSVSTSVNNVDADFYAVVANRLIAAAGSTVWFTPQNQPFNVLDLSNSHELPDGVVITGLRAIDQDLLIFTTQGIWVLRGLAYNIVDDLGNPQHQLIQLSKELSLWHEAGIAAWEHGYVVPMDGGVYLMDGVSSPVYLSRSIQPYIDIYRIANYSLGQGVVFGSHYLLPIPDAGRVFVCRLDRPVQDSEGNTIYPWTTFDFPVNINCFAVRRWDDGSLALLAGQSASPSRILDCSGFFNPSATVKADANGTAHQATWVGRAIPTGNGTLNSVRKCYINAQIIDAASDNPTMEVYYTTDIGAYGVTSPSFTDIGTIPETPGIAPWKFKVGQFVRSIQFKTVTSGAAQLINLKGYEVRIRPSLASRRG